MKNDFRLIVVVATISFGFNTNCYCDHTSYHGSYNITNVILEVSNCTLETLRQNGINTNTNAKFQEHAFTKRGLNDMLSILPPFVEEELKAINLLYVECRLIP